jgi:translation initiation factor SUI1
LTIIQGLSAPGKKVNLKKVLTAVNKEFHCSGGIADEPAYGGTVIKLTGDQRDGLKAFLIKNNLGTAANIKIHGV